MKTSLIAMLALAGGGTHKYDLSLNDIDNYQKDFSNLLSNRDFLKIHKIDFFTFSIFSNINKIHYIKYLIPEEEVKKHRKDVFHIKNDTKKIAFLCLPIEKSPIFYVFLEIYYYNFNALLFQIFRKLMD